MPGRLLRTLAVPLLLVVPALAQAGPPLLCFPMVNGDAPSLPWGSEPGWKQPLPGYDRSRLATDTLALLGPRVAVLERMETLRRAVIYASGDGMAERELFAALRARAADPQVESADALAVFDLGYAAEAFRQTRDLRGWLGAGPPEDGYALVRRAIALRGSEPELEYAAALIIVGRSAKGASDQHLARALEGAADGTRLARTIAAHHHLWGGRGDRLRAAAP